MRDSRVRILKSSLNTLFWCLALGVLIENYILLKNNRALEVAVDAATADAPVAPRIRDVAALNLSGRSQPIVLPLTDDAPRLLILTFSPGCPACLANQPFWEDATGAIRRNGRWRLLWLSRDPVEITLPYSTERQIPASEVLADPPYRTFTQLALREVPKAIVVGTDGRVEKVWPGVLNAAMKKEITNYLGLPYDSYSSVAK